MKCRLVPVRAPTSVVKSQIEIVEFIYAVVLVFSLTQGPVLRLWRSAELYTSVPITPTIQATFCSSASSFIDSGQKRHSSPSPPWSIGSVVWIGLLDDGLDILDEFE